MAPALRPASSLPLPPLVAGGGGCGAYCVAGEPGWQAARHPRPTCRDHAATVRTAVGGGAPRLTFLAREKRHFTASHPLPSGTPLMRSGLRESSMRMESASSMIATCSGRCSACAAAPARSHNAGTSWPSEGSPELLKQDAMALPQDSITRRSVHCTAQSPALTTVWMMKSVPPQPIASNRNHLTSPTPQRPCQSDITDVDCAERMAKALFQCKRRCSSVLTQDGSGGGGGMLTKPSLLRALLVLSRR